MIQEAKLTPQLEATREMLMASYGSKLGSKFFDFAYQPPDLKDPQRHQDEFFELLAEQLGSPDVRLRKQALKAYYEALLVLFQPVITYVNAQDNSMVRRLDLEGC